MSYGAVSDSGSESSGGALGPAPSAGAGGSPLRTALLSVNAEDHLTIVTMPGGGGAVVVPQTPHGAVARAGEKFGKAGLAGDAPGGDDDVVYRSIFLTVTAQFMGYAVLVSFQHKLKHAIGISDDSAGQSHAFGVAVSSLYIGNLVFRLAHNFLPLAPRSRVYFSMASMSASMALLVMMFTVGSMADVRWVYVAYALGGAGIGTFESNVLNCVTALGHRTKLYAISGMPVGFGVVLLGGFFLTAVGVPPVYIYAGILVTLVAGAAVFAFTIPVRQASAASGNLRSFVANVGLAREWAPQIAVFAVALMFDMFMVALFSGLMLYLLNGSDVPLFGPESSVTVPHDWFFVFYNSFSMIGDNIGRKLAYRWRRPGRDPINPLLFLGLSATGAACCLSLYAVLAPLGIFLIFMTNGLVYGTSSKHIDLVLDRRFNLIALSVWLAVGDSGSVAGSNLISHVRDWVCHYHEGAHYVCTSN